MLPVLSAVLACGAGRCRSSTALRLEHFALRPHVAVDHQMVHRPHRRRTERLFWVWLSRLWPGWRYVLAFVPPRTVLAWQQRRCRDHGRHRRQRGQPGRPTMAKEVRALIRTISRANPLWGAPRIVGERHKRGIDVAQSTVEKDRVRPQRPPAPTGKTFLNHHVQALVALEFFVVPTVPFRVLFVLEILAHERRGVVHGTVTAHPTAPWTAQHVVEACPWEDVPTYLLRDRDSLSATPLQQRVRHLGREKVVIAPRSPWQHPYVERLIGSIRRACLDHVIVVNARHLTRLLARSCASDHAWSTPRSLAMDGPGPRPMAPPERGTVIAVPAVGGLHHHYERLAACMRAFST